MTAPHPELASLRLFLTGPHPCSYLPGRLARNLVADPEAVDDALYSALARQGFRRSGEHVYRPRCPACRACQSLRIPVARFAPDRAQRRTWARNADLTVSRLEPLLREDHFALFQRYLAARHLDGGMDDATPESYLGFIRSSWGRTFLAEFRLERRLVAVAVVDVLGDGLSAVYTYYEPGLEARGLGTHAILWQIEEARARGLAHVYLGYWIAEAAKMRYKTRFRPCEVFRDGEWREPPGNPYAG